MKSLATWSCRSGSSASKVVRDGIGEADGEEPDEEEEEDKDKEEGA